MATIGSCIVLYPRAAVQYRLTLDVETPEGVKTGSVVNRLGFSLEPQIDTQRYNWGQTSGEAAAVDLGGRAPCFRAAGFRTAGECRDARPASVEALPFLAFGVDTFPDPQAKAAQVARMREQVELKGPLLPTLVTFSELNDPTMARVVQPDAFVAVFGPGARFKRAFFEMVPAGVWPLSLFGIGGEPVTRGIESKIPDIVDSKSWNEKLNLLPFDRCRLMVGTRALKGE